MRHIFSKTVVAGLLIMGMTSCSNDLNISSIDPQTQVTSAVTRVSQDSIVLPLIFKRCLPMNVTGLGRLTQISRRLPVSAGMPTVVVPSGLISALASMCCSVTSICRIQPTRQIRQTTNIIVQRYASCVHSSTGTSSICGTKLLSRTRPPL